MSGADPGRPAPLRVAIVNQPLDPILPPEQNSIGIWTYEVARRMAADHDVTVYGRYMRYLKERGDPPQVTDGGVRYRFCFAGPVRIWARLTSLWDRVRGPQSPIYASILYYLEFSLLVAWRIRAQRPDIVHIHNFTGFVPVIRALVPKAKLVLHMNCEWLSQLDPAVMERRVAQVDAVFGSSDHITNLVRDRFPQFADRCVTVYNGVDPDSFSFGPAAGEQTPSSPKIVFVGRVSPEKGVHDLLDAMSLVVESHPDAQLEVIGPVGALDRSFIVDVSDDELVRGLGELYDRPYGDRLFERTADGLADNVLFHGALPQSEVVEQVASATLLVNPSYSESFGMSLVEALASGVPVVATRVGGMKEIVDDRCGILVDRKDPEGLARAIVRLLDDAELRARFGAAGRERVEALFAWDRVAESALERYRELVAHGRIER